MLCYFFSKPSVDIQRVSFCSNWTMERTQHKICPKRFVCASTVLCKDVYINKDNYSYRT